MRRIVTAGLAFAALLCAEASADEGAPGDAWYAGAAAKLVLPQGGARLRRLAGGAARAGRYLTEAVALEAEAAWLEDSAGLSVRALWHLHGWAAFDRLFGYERFDPFLAAGATGWLHDGQVGPTAGVGALYYLTDAWALRLDADATLGIDSGAEAVFSLSACLQYSF